MKKLFFAALLLSSCMNKKVELVDLEIKLKDSLDHATAKWHQESADLTLPTSEAFSRDQVNALRVIQFQKAIDSIEMELKKY